MSLQSYIYFNVYCFNADRISLCYAPVCIWGNLLGGGGLGVWEGGCYKSTKFSGISPERAHHVITFALVGQVE